jgi:membrane-bound lytic murein transglycosylase A
MQGESIIRVGSNGEATRGATTGKQKYFSGRIRELPGLWKALGILLALAGCAQQVGPPVPTPTPVPAPAPAPPAPVPDNALLAGVHAGPAIETVALPGAARAFGAFLKSCPALLRRADGSGLTQPADWSAACQTADAIAPAANADDAAAADFFRRYFELAQIGPGSAFVTGYYEPEIAAARARMPGYEVPIYAKPPDLVDADAAAIAAGAPRRGRIENGLVVPYYERAEIEDGALAGRGLEIAWAADPVALFFLEIQGSGRLRLPDGSVMRIGYAGQNGRDYVGIGKLMRDRGLLEPGHTTMQDIVAWLRAHPDEGKALMRENKSYVFFKELTGPGPLGALGTPVTPRATVAADARFVPLGAPILLDLDRAEANGLWVAQDTGGAIKGANRFDTFWGAGDEAAAIAGGMTGRGRAWLLLPKGVLARIDAAPHP